MNFNSQNPTMNLGICICEFDHSEPSRQTKIHVHFCFVGNDSKLSILLVKG